MKRLWINLKYFFLAWLMITFGSFFLGKLAQRLSEPKPDINITAYEHLIASVQSGDLNQVKNHADYAQQVTTDPDIKVLGDLISRSSALALEQGHKTKAESRTLTGFWKSFAAGYANPLLGLEGLVLVWDSYQKDPDKLAATIDARYQQYYVKMDSARKIAVTTFWIFFISFCVLAIYFRKTLLRREFPEIFGSNPPSVSNPPKAAPEPPKIEEPIITCPNCQARNRNRILSSGQKLVCGQCKTVLLSVS